MPVCGEYVKNRFFHKPKVCDKIRLPEGEFMRFFFLISAMMGPRFFARFLLFFILGMGLFLYCFLRA